MDLSKKIVNDAVELAKLNAVNVLKGLKFDDIQALVEAEMASVIKPWLNSRGFSFFLHYATMNLI